MSHDYGEAPAHDRAEPSAIPPMNKIVMDSHWRKVSGGRPALFATATSD